MSKLAAALAALGLLLLVWICSRRLSARSEAADATALREERAKAQDASAACRRRAAQAIRAKGEK